MTAFLPGALAPYLHGLPPEDGVHNLTGPYGLSILVWRLARKRDLIELGVPPDRVTPMRRVVTGSTHPARRGRMLLATGLWGCETVDSIVRKTGIPRPLITRLASRPISRAVARRGERLSQATLAVLVLGAGTNPVRVARRFRIPTLDAFLLAKRAAWLMQFIRADADRLLELPESELDELWIGHGLQLRVHPTHLYAAELRIRRVRRPR